MMEDLLSVDLDLDLGVDGSNLDFLPEDLFNFFEEDLKDITENDVIPDIQNLINFEEDEHAVDDDVQWDFDLNTANFLESLQTPINNQSNEETSYLNNLETQSENSNSSMFLSNASSDSIENTLNESSFSSDESSDFLDLLNFKNYYSLDSNNNLISHPISNLSVEELATLTNTIETVQPYSFDLSNNFGGFADVQSALNLVNGIKSKVKPSIVKKKKSKGTSLLANKPKSYKLIKKEMLEKKINQNLNRNKFRVTTFAQDHDYCSVISTLHS